MITDIGASPSLTFSATQSTCMCGIAPHERTGADFLSG